MKKLDDILKRCEAAPKGPLEIIGLKDAPVEAVDFYAHARTDLPLVVKALQKAVEYIKENAQHIEYDANYEGLKGCIHNEPLTLLIEIQTLLGDEK